MNSPEAFKEPEATIEVIVDREPTLIRLGHLGLVDAMLYEHPNPPEAPNYWKSIN